MSSAQQQQFEQFWRAYPHWRRVGKLAAEREWERRRPDLDTVLQALAQQRQQWTDMKFTPHARTLAVAGTLAGWRADAAPAVAEDGDWFADCRQRHGGRCNGRRAHAIQLELDALKAVPE